MTRKTCFNVAATLMAVFGLGWGAAYGQISIVPDADARLANDPNRGPTSNTGNSSVWEVRWHEAPRVRIGYVRYDISGISSSLFDTATISGTFRDSGTNGSGVWNVYGLNDDIVADGLGRLGNDWAEDDVTYANAAGVNNSSLLGEFEILASETSLLGTLSLDGIDVQPLSFSSNTTDLPLGSFLSADTDGLVTFLFTDTSQTGVEWQIDSKEGNMSGGHGPTVLNFFPDPGDVDGMNGVDLVDLQIIADHFRQNVTLRTDGDLTGDNFVDFDDFDEWKRNYTGSTASLNLNFLTTRVPEPGTIILAGFGLAVAIALKQYRRNGS